MIHPYDIEVKKDDRWRKTNWGGRNEDAVLSRVLDVADDVIPNRYEAVRVTSERGVLWTSEQYKAKD